MSSTKKILLTGGNGRVASLLSKRFQQENIPFLFTSRRGQAGAPAGVEAVKFDWADPSTFAPIFEQHEISSILLVSPWDPNPITMMGPFIDMAVERGVRRFVVIAGYSATKGGPWLGQVWAHLDTKNVEYSLIRPSWFNENFVFEPLLTEIKTQGKLFSQCEDGLSPFVDSGDLAEVAHHLLTTDKSIKDNYVVYGPEFLTFTDVAEKLSKATGKEIEHVRIDTEHNNKRFREAGYTEFITGLWSYLEQGTARGEQQKLQEVPNEIQGLIGREPTSFDEWAVANREAWL